MKSIKLKQPSVPAATLYQRRHGERERSGVEESTNENLSARMLENLKMALFFSRVQSQMNHERPEV